LTTSNKATLEKLDSLGSNHAIHLTNVKKTITEENLNLKVLIDEKERLFQEAQKNSNLNDLRKKVTIFPNLRNPVILALLFHSTT
jgi:hypothetical protein